MREYMRQMLSGPGTLRFILQPAIAILLGVLHGVRDAHFERTPYFASLVRSQGDRGARLWQGLKTIAVPLTIALVASVVFQYLIRSRVRPLMAVMYAALFVAVPYLLSRSLTNRAVTGRRHRRHPTGPLRPVT